MARDSRASMIAGQLTIRNGAKMSDARRRHMAAWLRRQANELVKLGDTLAPAYTAKYYIPKREHDGS